MIHSRKPILSDLNFKAREKKTKKEQTFQPALTEYKHCELNKRLVFLFVFTDE